MADDDLQRMTAKRQIARLIGGASLPVYVLSETDQIVFANDALGELLQRDPDSLIGLVCSHAIPVDDSREAHLASLLGLPSNANRHLASIQPLPPIELNASEAFSMALGDGGKAAWIRISIPLDSNPIPTMLCVLKTDREDMRLLVDSLPDAAMQRSLVASGPPALSDTRMWFLKGDSPELVRTFRQLEAAAESQHPVRLIGPRSGPLLEIATAIAQRRMHGGAHSQARCSIHTIECHLMDRDLMRSMFEMIEEQSRSTDLPALSSTVILNHLDQLPQALIPDLVKQANKCTWRMLAISSLDNLALRAPSDSLWGVFCARLDTHLVQVAPLSRRLSDIEVLISSWLESHARASREAKKFRWSREFSDAMMAYAWPGDCREFSETMEHAIRTCTDQYLTERDLPASLRTFPSQAQRAAPEGGIALDQLLEDIERQLICKANERFPRNRAAAAKLLGISRSRLLRRMQHWGLESSEKVSAEADDQPIFEEINDDAMGEDS